MLAWVASDVVAASLGGRFYTHYFAQLIPSLAVLATITLASVWRFPKLHALITVGVLLFILVYSPVMSDAKKTQTDLHSLITTKQLPPLATRFEPQKAHVIDWITTHTQPGEPVYIWGAEAELNFFTKRPSVTKYSFAYPLLVPGYTRPENQEQFIADFEREKPQYLIDTSRTNGYIPSIETETLNYPNDIFSAEPAQEILAYFRRTYEWQERVEDWEIYRRRK